STSPFRRARTSSSSRAQSFETIDRKASLIIIHTAGSPPARGGTRRPRPTRGDSRSDGPRIRGSLRPVAVGKLARDLVAEGDRAALARLIQIRCLWGPSRLNAADCSPIHVWVMAFRVTRRDL